MTRYEKEFNKIKQKLNSEEQILLQMYIDDLVKTAESKGYNRGFTEIIISTGMKNIK